MNVQEQIPRLLPNLGALQSAITMANLASQESYRKTAYLLEQLPYCVGNALAALDAATQYQEESVRSVEVQKVGPNVEYSIPDEQRDRIAYQVDAFFEAAVRAQNGLWPYLQHRYKQSLPYSFRKLVKQVRDGDTTFGASIDAAILDYWSRSGERVRAYRVLSQHHVVLPSNARVVITAGQIESFFMPLPTNPEVKSPLDLIYNNDSPNAIPYVVDAFLGLVKFLRHAIRNTLGIDLRDPKIVQCHMFKEGMMDWPMRTGAIVTAHALRERLDGFVEEFRVDAKSFA